MQKHLNKFLQSVVVFPVLATSFAIAPFPGVVAGSPLAAAISPDQTRTLASEMADNQQSIIDLQAAKIDAYFTKYGRKLAGHGRELATEALKNDLPVNTLAAIAQVESSGYDYACPSDPENGFGYNSCHGTNFATIDDAIKTVAETISGNRPSSARYYAGKDFKTKLIVYNGNANRQYYSKIMYVMDAIDTMDVQTQTASAAGTQTQG